MKKEILARSLVVFFIVIAFSVPFVGRWLNSQKQGNIIDLHARTFENGGWTMDTLQTRVGEPIHIRLTSEDVMHGFAVGGYNLTPIEVMPGEFVETTLAFDKPGEYTFFCNRWCSPTHTRMRGTIEVLPADK
ncbi:MAG: cupredoxin domain-containing protein [Anaerolineaceae bacterium]